VIDWSKTKYEITIREEHLPVEGNAMASGEDAYDRACEAAILLRLDRDDLWAWCMVTVTASHPDLPFDGDGVVLGACSYKDEEDFKAGGYYEDMKAEALENLQEKVKMVLDAAS